MVITDPTGAKYRSIDFTLTETGAENLGVSPGSRVISGGNNNWTAFWDQNEGGIKVYKTGDFSRIYRYISTPGVVLCAARDVNRLVAVCENGYVVYDSALLTTTKNPFVYEFHSLRAVVAGAVGGGYVFLKEADGNVRACVTGTETATELATASSESALFSDGATTYAYSPNNPKMIYVFTNGIWSLKPLETVPGESIPFAAPGMVFMGGMAFDSSAPSLALLYQISGYDKVVYRDENALIAGGKVCSSVTGEPFGEYFSAVVSASRDGDHIYLVYADGTLERVKAAGLYGAAPVNVAVTGKKLTTRAYEYTVPLASGGDIKDAAYDASSDTVSVLRYGDNRLYFLNHGDCSLKYTVYLKYVPSALIEIEGGVAVLFSNVNKIYLTAFKEYINFPAKVSSVCVSGGRLFAVCGGRVCEYIRSSGTLAYPFGEMEADGIACSGSRIYVSTVYDVTGYDAATLTPFAVCQSMYSGNVAASGKYVIAGNFIYGADDLGYTAAVIGKVFDFKGNTLLTDTGMFSLSEGMYITGYASDSLHAVMLPGYTALLFGKLSIKVINSQGYDPTRPATVTGVSDGGVYYGSVSVRYDRGTAYMDGKKIESGYKESKAGRHTLTVVTAWNLHTVITFTVKYNPSSIVIQSGDLKLGVGQTATLKTQLFPEGAEGAVVFTSASANIRVTPAGLVTALSQGEAVVRAEVSGTNIYTTCKITVTEAQTICSNPDYVIDRGSGVLGMVPSGTTVDIFLSYFTAAGFRFAVEDKTGAKVTEGIVATGMKVVKYDMNGNLTDGLVISVRGDLDGDGRVTVNDADILYRYLLLNYELENCVFSSADYNANARITSVDLKELKPVLDYSASGGAIDSEVYLNIPLFGYKGSEFYVTVQNDRMPGAGSVAGAVYFDDEKLYVSRITSFGGEVYTFNSKGRLEYSVLGINNLGDKAKFLRVYFGIKAEAAPGVTYVDFADTTVSQTGLYSMKPQREEFEIKSTPAAELNVTSKNSALKFRRDIYEYNVLIPYGDDYLDLSFDCPAGCYVYFNNQPIYDDAEKRLTLTYLNQKGEVSEYIIWVSHGEEHIPENNSLLASLEATGLVITPVFDPLVTDYTAEAEYATETVIVAIPAGERATVLREGPNTLSVGENVFILSCVSENGSQTVYRLTITMLPNPDESANQESSEQSSGDTSSEQTSSEAPHESSPDESNPDGGSGETPESSYKSESRDTEKPEKSKTAGYVLIIAGLAIIASTALVTAVRKRFKNKENF